MSSSASSSLREAQKRYYEKNREKVIGIVVRRQVERYNTDPEYRAKMLEKQVYFRQKRKERFENDPEYREMIRERRRIAQEKYKPIYQQKKAEKEARIKAIEAENQALKALLKEKKVL